MASSILLMMLSEITIDGYLNNIGHCFFLHCSDEVAACVDMVTMLLWILSSRNSLLVVAGFFIQSVQMLHLWSIATNSHSTNYTVSSSHISTFWVWTVLVARFVSIDSSRTGWWDSVTGLQMVAGSNFRSFPHLLALAGTYIAVIVPNKHLK